jgi:hypothetical protein
MDKPVNKSLHSISIRSELSNNHNPSEISLENYSSWNVQNFTEILNRPKVNFI